MFPARLLWSANRASRQQAVAVVCARSIFASHSKFAGQQQPTAFEVKGPSSGGEAPHAGNDGPVPAPKTVSKLEQLQKHPRVQSVVSDMRMYQSASSQAIKKTYYEWWHFYEQFSHMDEVRQAHDKVIAIQQELQQAQYRRVELQHKLMIVQNEVKQHQAAKSRLDDDTDPRYLQLAKVMIEAGQREKQTAREYQIEDERERNLFTHLTAAVMASHEKEKVYANTVKYWSIIGSLMSALLAIVGTSLGYHYRQRSIDSITDRYTEQVLLLKGHFDQLTEDLNGVQREMQSSRIVFERSLDMLDAKHRERLARTEAQAKNVTESWTHWTYRHSSSLLSWLNPWSYGRSSASAIADRKRTTEAIIVAQKRDQQQSASDAKAPESWSAFVYRKTTDGVWWLYPTQQ